jgi:hypothetical protein
MTTRSRDRQRQTTLSARKHLHVRLVDPSDFEDERVLLTPNLKDIMSSPPLGTAPPRRNRWRASRVLEFSSSAPSPRVSFQLLDADQVEQRLPKKARRARRHRVPRSHDSGLSWVGLIGKAELLSLLENIPPVRSRSLPRLRPRKKLVVKK